MYDKYAITNKYLVILVDSYQREYVIIRSLWGRGADCVLNMRVVNTDAKYYQQRPLEKCPLTADCENKRKYIESCLQQRRHFFPFVASVHGMVDMETKATLK